MFVAEPPKSSYNSSGFGIVEIIVALAAIAVLASIGWYVWHNNDTSIVKNAVNTSVTTQKYSSDDIAKSEGNRVLDTLSTYCQQTYRQEVWSNKVDAFSIMLVKTDKSPTVTGDYARMAAGCDSSQVPTDQKPSGFVAYLHKVDNEWQVYSREQETPDCQKFDGQAWPLSIISQCNDNGSYRAPK